MQSLIINMYNGVEFVFTKDGHDICTFHQDGVDMPNGLTLFYPDLRKKGSDYTYRSSSGDRSKIYGGLFMENIDQAASRIIVGDQMLEIAEKYRVVMMTHDEVVYLAPWREADKALEFGIECLSKSPEWAPNLPLAAEGGHAKNYGDAKH
jgi:DNA polymerase